MIIFSNKHSKEQIAKMFKDLMQMVMLPSVDNETAKSVMRHFDALGRKPEGLVVTCRLETFPEKGTTAIWMELGPAPVYDSGKKLEWH